MTIMRVIKGDTRNLDYSSSVGQGVRGLSVGF